jgi:hypothetical protein
MGLNSGGKSLCGLFLGRGGTGGMILSSCGGSVCVLFLGRGRLGDESELAW